MNKTNKNFDDLVNKPIIIYEDNELIDYNLDYYSKLPSVDPPNGFFILNIPNSKIKIDNKTGVLNCNKLEVGQYTIPIIYYFNNISTQYDFILTIKPIFYYNNEIAIINPLNGIFESNDNILLNNGNGNININLLDVGKKDYIINYTVNNITTQTIYNSIIIPKINLDLCKYDFYYNDPIKIELDFSYKGGQIDINNDQFDFDNNYIINKQIINVGIYYLTIKYELNNISDEKNITITIYPKISYNIKDLEPIVDPPSGIFNLITDHKITIDDTGKLFNNNLSAGNYDITIEYTVNNIKSIYNHTFIVEPYLYYEDTNKEIIQGLSDFSQVPKTNIVNSTFSIDKLDIASIDSNTGMITFNNNINIGTHNLIINCSFKQNVSEYNQSYNYILKILPSIKYKQSTYKIIYNQYYESDQPNIDDYLSDCLFSLVNNIKGITIDSNTGVLYFNKDDIIDVNNYNISINLNYNNSNTNATIILIVIPECIYDSTKQTVNYSQNFVSIQPKVNPICGIFTLDLPPLALRRSEESTPLHSVDPPLCETKDLVFDIDENGIISVTNLDVGNYNFIIKYTINNITQNIDYQINCIPTINYINNSIELDYLDKLESNIPIVSPQGGIFKLKDHPHGININTNGQIQINNLYIGYYTFSVIYQINTIYVTNIFNILVKPKVLYPKSIFNYNNFINGEEPNVLVNGGIFEISEDNYTKDMKRSEISENNYEMQWSNYKITIDKNKGILFLEKLDPAEYSINIKYTLNNVSYNTIYNFIIKPAINYNYKSLYKLNENIFIEPTISHHDGIFTYISSGVTPDTRVVLDEKGNFIANNLELGEYSFDIEYTYNNISSCFNIKFNVESDIFYDNKNYIYKENNIISPNNFNNEGIFINDLCDSSGNINISTFDVGSYNYDIIYRYESNDSKINLQFNIIPSFCYDISNVTLIYGEYENAVNKANVNYSNETSKFILLKEYDFVEINENTGIINFDNNLKLGNHEIEITYTVNNISVNTIIYVTVLPSVIYNQHNISIKYNELLKINKPVRQLDFGKLSIINTDNNFIINNDGSIESKNLLNIGEYNLKIKYIIDKKEIPYLVDNSEIIKNINIKVLHDFYYKNNNITQIYGADFESELPIVSHENGIFSLLKDYDNISINNENGKIKFLSILDLNIYNLKIAYSLNNITTYTTYIYTLIPKIYSKNNLLTFNYNSLVSGVPTKDTAPLVKPEGGKFLCKDYNINENTGEIIFKNILVDTYNIKIIYEFNNQQNFINYKINILPTIEYVNLDNIIVYKSNKYSTKPNVIPSNGIFIGNNVNNFGQIIYDNFNVGHHTLNIKYQVNNQINETIVKFEIIPYFYYDKLEYEINFGDNVSSYKPITKPNNLLFEPDNQGIIDLSNKPVGIHNIIVNYGNSKQKLVLKVKPVFYYEETNIIMSCNDNKIIYPIIITPGGKFTSNNKEIIPDENNGIINLKNINIMNNEFIIYYELNSITNSQSIKINCKPVFNYSINKMILEYGSNDKSVVPEMKPLWGNIISSNLPNNVTIDNDGVIIFGSNIDVGNYILGLEYMNIKINYELIINPIIYYEKEEIFYYGFNNYSCKPIIKPSNILGKFYINNHNFYINSNGIIIINENTPINSYELTVSYQNINTIYKFKIIPFIFYKNTKITYGDMYTIIPEIKIQEGGIFHIQHDRLSINNLGQVSNINLLEPDHYKIIIYYNYNNITYNTYLKLYIKPYINYVNKLILLPDQGYLSYDDTIINVNEFNEIVLLSNNIGKYNLDIEYEYNNIKSVINIDITAYTENLYKYNQYTLYYDESIKISSIIKQGFFEIKETFPNIIFYSNGNICIDQVNVGIYFLCISCYSNNHIIKNLIKINIKPRIAYKTDDIIFGYHKLEPYITYSSNGTYIFKNNYKNIKYNKNGTIIFNNTYPDSYNFNVDYIYNNSTESISFTIKVIPSLYINLKSIIINYTEGAILDNILALPSNGIFKHNLTDVIISKNILHIGKNKWIGTYDLNVEYIVNNKSNFTSTKLIIQPLFYYNNNNIELTYYDNLISEKPYFYPYGGSFSLRLDDNIGLVEINSETGILKFSNIIMGEFNIKVIYNLNEFNIETNYNIISKPVLKYNNFLTINYQDNYEISSKEPLYYPNDGQFSIKSDLSEVSHIKNINEVKTKQNISISQSGIITFSNLDVNLYNFDIQYIINNKIIKTNYIFIVNPTIIYINNNITLEYNTNNIIDCPNVNPKNGFFTSHNLPHGFIIDNKTGIIKTIILNKIYKINNISKINNKISDKGNYTITINYNIHNQSASTNLFINII